MMVVGNKELKCKREENHRLWTIDEESSYHKTSLSFPRITKPDILIHDILATGIDNLTYYSGPNTVNKGLPEVKRCRRKRLPYLQSTSGVDPAKLTKVPCFRIWRLHFKASRNTKSCSRPLIAIIILVLFLVLLLSGAAAIAHFAVSGKWLGQERWLQLKNQGAVAVESRMRVINRRFTAGLQNSTSPEYLRLTTEILHTLDVTLRDTLLADYYYTADQFRFSNGSVVVMFRILLKYPIMNAAQQVGIEIMDALGKTDGILPPGILLIDVKSLRFQAVKMKNPVFNNGSSILETTENKMVSTVSEVSWSTWSDWSSCFSDEGVCDSSNIQTRFRVCVKDNEEITNSQECAETTDRNEIEIRSCDCLKNPLSDTYRFFSPASFSEIHLTASWAVWTEWTSCYDRVTKMCDGRQTQRRTRYCLDSEGIVEPLPQIMCTRHKNERGTQIRICSCSENMAVVRNDSEVYKIKSIRGTF